MVRWLTVTGGPGNSLSRAFHTFKFKFKLFAEARPPHEGKPSRGNQGPGRPARAARPPGPHEGQTSSSQCPRRRGRRGASAPAPPFNQGGISS
jgi:hypothetical protein